MKIIRFTAENFKRLHAVEITPDGTVQVVTGKNAAGKSSVLDAIWAALGGGAASKGTVKPIREGQEDATVRLDLGDLVVTRTWVGDKTALKVESQDGARYGSPQGVLDALVGKMSFDPLEFTRLSARDQVAALLDIVDLNIDLDDVAARRQAEYDSRTAVGRTIKTLEGQAESLGKPEDAPEQETSVAELITAYRRADIMHRDHREADQRVLSLEGQVERAKAALKVAETALHGSEGALAAARGNLEDAPELPDLDEIQAKIDTVEVRNNAVRRNIQRAEVKANLTACQDQFTLLSDSIKGIDKTKADALAKAKFPVPGLAFDDGGVTYQGVPFSQASASEQIRVSLAMAMALNPKLRVVRIMDGSLLDADSMALIAAMAKEQDYQVWIETVDRGDGVGVLIEDGKVAN